MRKTQDAKIWIAVGMFVSMLLGYEFFVAERWGALILASLVFITLGIIIYPWKGPIGR